MELFMGREMEVQQVLAQMDRLRVTILMGLSGVGKSSLIQAGVVPALRIMRERGRGFSRPVLVVRGWRHLAGMSPVAMLCHAIRTEIDRLALWAEAVDGQQRLLQDVKSFQQVSLPGLERDGKEPLPPMDQLITYVASLCDAAGGIILIIDQAEELLGSGMDRAAPELLSAVGALYMEESRARLLLSLREEHYGRLYPLHRYIEGFERRVFRLAPMPLSTIHKVVVESAEIAGIQLRDEELKTILGWLEDKVEGSESEEGEASFVNLLRLQALLVCIFEWASARGLIQNGKELKIDKDTLRWFRQEHNVRDFAELKGPLMVFLCHSSEDKNPVRQIYQAIKEAGMRPWLDEMDLRPAEEWEPTIRRAVRESDIMLVCLSSRSVAKTGFVQKEIKFALDRADEMPEGKVYIMPARLEDCPVPDRLKKWHWIDLFREGGMDRLVAVLRDYARRQ